MMLLLTIEDIIFIKCSKTPDWNELVEYLEPRVFLWNFDMFMPWLL